MVAAVAAATEEAAIPEVATGVMDTADAVMAMEVAMGMAAAVADPVVTDTAAMAATAPPPPSILATPITLRSPIQPCMPLQPVHRSPGTDGASRPVAM